MWMCLLLPRKVRSMLTLAMLIAHGRPHELWVPVRGTIGVGKEEISEILLHGVICCGVP
jgi:4-carboxymuconolactone decarboxylase